LVGPSSGLALAVSVPFWARAAIHLGGPRPSLPRLQSAHPATEAPRISTGSPLFATCPLVPHPCRRRLRKRRGNSGSSAQNPKRTHAIGLPYKPPICRALPCNCPGPPCTVPLVPINPALVLPFFEFASTGTLFSPFFQPRLTALSERIFLSRLFPLLYSSIN